MVFGLEKRKPTRLIVVRHLKTPGTEQTDTQIKQDPRFIKLENVVLGGSLQNLEDVKAEVALLGPGLRADYHDVVSDAQLPLLPGQEERGRRIGRVVEEKYGPVSMIDVSPYERALRTLAYAQEGSPALFGVPVTVRVDLRERSMGPEAEVLPFGRLFYLNHPEELEKFYRNREKYTYPGGENNPTFLRRVEKVGKEYERATKYEGETILQVSHSRVFQAQLLYLTRPSLVGRMLGQNNDKYKSLMVDTGSITVFEAKSRLLPFTRRRFKVVSLNEKVD